MSQAELFEEPGFELGDVERWCRARDIAPIVGTDEAGRGPLAGPVYAAAVVLDLDDDEWFEMLDDSKKLSEDERLAAAEVIKARAVAWSVTCRDAREIDRINILQASLRAMEEAIDEVCQTLADPPGRVFIDGNQPLRTSLPQQTLVKGDGRSYHVAAASILAKVERDAFMVARHEEWPEYAFDSNKGYPTRAHRDAIVEHGPCSLHRQTFGGVREHIDRLRT